MKITFRQWDDVFENKSSQDILEIIKEFEGIPHVKTGVMDLLDSKEKEMIKARNSDLFKIKKLEQ
jgi:hypothetical protein